MSSGRGCSSRLFVLRDAHYVPPCWPPRAESLVSPQSDLTCRGPVRLCYRWYRPAVNGSTGKTCWFSRKISLLFFCVFFFFSQQEGRLLSFVIVHHRSRNTLCGQRERSDVGGRSRVGKTKLEKESSSKPEQFEFVVTFFSFFKAGRKKVLPPSSPPSN